MKDNFLKGANDNIIFCTSFCNNNCIMCCQPPLQNDDSNLHYINNLIKIKKSATDIDYICITGGEPTLSCRLFDYMDAIWDRMPDCTIHLLSNGRNFADISYLKKFYKKTVGKICIGIPIHSDNALDHDIIAGSKGSFYETIKGLHNLGVLGYDIELRIIIMKCNVNRIVKIAEFIIKNLPFVSQVSFMGLEITGKAFDNYQKLFVEQEEYNTQLIKAIRMLDSCKIHSKIFNIPLCLLNNDLWQYTCKSISNWKKTNLSTCKECLMIEECCGIFSTSKIISNQIISISKQIPF